VTSLPRPFAGAPRVWHGSATTLTSAALAAQWGDPLFSANAIQITRGPVLVGSPQQIIDKIMYFHEAFGHEGGARVRGRDHLGPARRSRDHDPRRRHRGSGARCSATATRSTTSRCCSGCTSPGQLKLDELVTRKYSLDQVNQAYQDMNDGKNIRGVIIHEH
jgi:hypothetical protein